MNNEPMVDLTVTVENRILEKLDALCRESGCTREEKIKELLTWGLDQGMLPFEDSAK